MRRQARPEGERDRPAKRERPAATIWFESGCPVPIPILSNILNALNREFRRAFRRDLVVAPIGQAPGGIRIEDTVVFATRIDHLFEFMHNLRLSLNPAMLGCKDEGRSAIQPTIRVHETVKALARAAMKTSSPIRIELRSRAGHVLNFHVKIPQSRQVTANQNWAGTTTPVSPKLRHLEERLSEVFEDFVRVAAESSAGPPAAFDPHGPMALMLTLFMEKILSHRGGVQSIADFASHVRALGHTETALWLEQTANELAKHYC